MQIHDLVQLLVSRAHDTKSNILIHMHVAIMQSSGRDGPKIGLCIRHVRLDRRNFVVLGTSESFATKFAAEVQ